MFTPWKDLLYSLRPLQGTFVFPAGRKLFLAEHVFSIQNGQAIERNRGEFDHLIVFC